MIDPRYMLIARGLTEKRLADYLRSGNVDQAFLDMLAMLLDPPGKGPLYRLQIVNGSASRPKGATYDEGALVDELRALEAKGLTRGEKKSARMDILARFGISERTARAAVREADEMDALWELVKARQ